MENYVFILFNIKYFKTAWYFQLGRIELSLSGAAKI